MKRRTFTLTTGAVSIGQTISAATASVAGGLITSKGGTSVNVTQTALTVAPTATAASKDVTFGTTTVTGGTKTSSVSVTQAPGVAAVPFAASAAAINQVETVTFTALAANATVTVGGLTFKAGPLGATAAQVATAFSNLTDGAIAGSAVNGVGSFSGALTGYSSGAASSGSVSFTATAAVTGSSTPVLAPGGLNTVTVTTIGQTAVLGGAGNAGVTNALVTVNDAAFATGTSATKGTISTVTASNFNGLNINNNALSVLNVTGGAINPVTGWAGAVSAGAVTIDNDSTGAVLAADKTTTLALNASGKLGSVTDQGVYTTLNVTVGAGGAQIAGLSTAAVTTLTVGGSGTLDLTSPAGLTALKSLTVSGSAGLSNGASFVDFGGLANLASVNTTGTTGTVTTKVDTSKVTYTGGAGIDNLTTTTTVTQAISLGAGNDTLTVGGSTLNNNVSGGDGTDTLSMTAANAATASASTVFASYLSGFEALTLTGAGAAVNLDKLGLTNSVKLDASGTATLNELASNATLTLATTNATTAVSLSTAAWAVPASTADVVNLAISVKDGGHANGTVTSAGVETINIASSDLSVLPTTVPGSSIGTLTLADTSTKSVNVSGSGSLSLTTTANTALTTVNASAMTGNFTYTTSSTAAATVTGGSGADVLTAAGTVGHTLIGGAGADTLNANAFAGTLTGGAGKDTFVVASAGATLNIHNTITDFSVGDKLTLVDVVTGVETFAATKVTLAAGVAETLANYANAAAVSATGASVGAISWFQFGADTYIVEDRSNLTTFVDGTDIIVKLSGLIDLSNAVLNTSAAGAPNLVLFG